MKIIIIVLAVLAGFALSQLHGLDDLTIAKIEAMQTTCEQSYKVQDGALEEKCGALIDEVQAGGNIEVLQQGGDFIAEVK